MRWTDFDLDGRETVIARSIASDDRESKLAIEKTTKTHQARRIAIVSGTVESLRDHRWSMLERALAAGASYATDAFVFSDDVAGARPWHQNARNVKVPQDS